MNTNIAIGPLHGLTVPRDISENAGSVTRPTEIGGTSRYLRCRSGHRPGGNNLWWLPQGLAWLFLAAALLPAVHSAAAPERKIPEPQAVFADAVAVWHLADFDSADGQSPLKLHGAAKVGVALKGAERAASLARGGDGVVAEITGGWFDAGQGGDGRLNLRRIPVLFRPSRSAANAESLESAVGNLRRLRPDLQSNSAN
jgi:hypothetical protein